MDEVDQEKLTKILCDNEVNISRKGNVCLHDLVVNVIGSKNPKTYIARLSDKYDVIVVNSKPYVNKEDCINILKEAKFKKCKNIYTRILIDNGDKTSLIDVEREIFQFEGYKFFALFVDNDEGVWDIWVKGSEAAYVLGYADTEQAVRIHVQKKNKCSFDVLVKTLDHVRDTYMKKMHPGTIFINMAGFFNLIHKSKKEMAKRICQWIDNDVLPSLMRYGIYVMQPAQIKIIKLYDMEMILKYSKKPVMYIVYVGKYDGIHLFKYGLSRNIERRIYKEHALQFDTCKVIYVDECANCEAVEKLFENRVISLKLHRETEINGKNQTELFTVTTKYTHDDAIAEMTKLVADYKLPEVAQAVDKINMLTNVVDIYKHSDEMQKLIIQFMQSDNYRFAVDANLQMAKLDSETKLSLRESDIKLRNIELETERVRCSRVAMERGYPVGDIKCPPKATLLPKNKSKSRSNVVVL